MSALPISCLDARHQALEDTRDAWAGTATLLDVRMYRAAWLTGRGNETEQIRQAWTTRLPAEVAAGLVALAESGVSLEVGCG